MKLINSILHVSRKNQALRSYLKQAGLGDWIREKRDQSEEKRSVKRREKGGEDLDGVGGTSEDFRSFVEGRTFRSKKTKNDVKFDSLPEDQQREIYQEWNGKKCQR